MNKSELRAALKEVEDMIDNAGDYDDIEELENERQEIMRQLRTIKSSYDSENVVFRATTRGGKNFVEVIDTGTDFDRYEIKMNDSIDYSDTIKGVLATLIHHSGWKSGMFDKIEFDDTGMSLGEQYLQIMKMINKEFGFLYKSPTGSRERQYYFDIIRFISRNIKNGTMSVEELIEKSKDALRAKGIMSSRRISSSQRGFENVADDTQYDDYHIDTRGMGILDVENIISGIESRGNQAVLTVNCSDGSAYHTQFTLKDWKEFKESKNASGAQITDVWITEVKPSYVRSAKTLTGKQKNDFIKKAMKMQGYNDKEANQMINQNRIVKSALSGKEWYDYVFNLGYDSYFKNESYKDARDPTWGGEEREAWYNGYSAAMQDERDDKE